MVGVGCLVIGNSYKDVCEMLLVTAVWYSRDAKLICETK